MEVQLIVYLFPLNLFKEGYKPDLVISGINIGANMGEDITYSGTAAGAMEAVIHGIHAIAISQVCIDKCHDIKMVGILTCKKILWISF